MQERTLNTKVFESFPILQTQRLLLREIRPEDADSIFRMRSNARVNRFIARPEMKEASSSEELVKRTINAYKNRQGIGWTGILRNKGECIGTCGFNSIDYPNLRAEIGGELNPDFWGKRIALEAFTAIINFGLKEFGLHSIEAKVQAENRGAIFLLETLGFKKEAHFRDRMYFQGEFIDMAVYSLVKNKK